MKLTGEIEINGVAYKAIMEITDKRGKGVTYVPTLGRYKAYGYVEGGIRFYGYYKTEREAIEASRLQRNLARERRTVTASRTTGSGVTYDTRTSRWRVQLSIQGQRVSLGRYGTYGHAVLARDVVARRTGKTVVVDDYAMPLGLVSDPVARSYITDRIMPPTPDEIAEYQRRVDMLNAQLRIT